MKIFRAELEEIIGMLGGAVFWYLLTFIIITVNFRISVPNQIITWVDAGLLVFFIIAGHYIVSSKVIDEKKRVEDIIDLKSNLIGYFLWLILMVFAYLMNIEISSNASIIGGYILIFLILVYMRKRMAKMDVFAQYNRRVK